MHQGEKSFLTLSTQLINQNSTMNKITFIIVNHIPKGNRVKMYHTGICLDSIGMLKTPFSFDFRCCTESPFVYNGFIPNKTLCMTSHSNIVLSYTHEYTAKILVSCSRRARRADNTSVYNLEDIVLLVLELSSSKP